MERTQILRCYCQHANSHQCALFIFLSTGRIDRWSPAVVSNSYCVTTKDLFSESSKKKQQQLPRAFRFMDTIPQKQARATNVTGALLTNNCILEQYEHLYRNTFIAALDTVFHRGL